VAKGATRIGSFAVERVHPPGQALPDRYRVAHDSGGLLLTCVEAPTVTVRVRQGVTATAAAARSAAPGSIFLDGAAHGAPFVDTQREVYNLDHHEGCVRAFTLATCEQAMVLIRKGLDLRRRDWTVYANDADLDTVLAIWVLLNHIRLNDPEDAVRRRVMPLLRLQGVVDAQGLEMRDLCGLPDDALAEAQDWIDELRSRELALKARGRWQDRDRVEYTADRLRAIDRLVYEAESFGDVQEIEHLARVEIANDSVAIVCRAKTGIYEVEHELRRLHGRRLGVVVLETAPNSYSIRQVNSYLPATLDSVYARLNLIDPVCGGSDPANRWGGSAEIGGSPRATGTRLGATELAEACRDVFSPPTKLRRAARVVEATLLCSAVMLAAITGVLSGESLLRFPFLLAGLGGGVLALRALRVPGVYGFRQPASYDWLGLLPIAMVGAIAGGVWIPSFSSAPALAQLASVLMLPVAAELLFRGFMQGSLITSFAIQESSGRWFISWPTVLAAALYATWGSVLQSSGMALADPLIGNLHPAVPFVGGLAFAAAAGVARERSESVASAIVLHWFGVMIALIAHAGWGAF
jgi:membrane protease YdiL (CAAX protease family)